MDLAPPELCKTTQHKFSASAQSWWMASCLNSHSNLFLWFEFESQLVKEELDELSLELDEAADLRHDLQASVGRVWKSV